MPGQLLWPLHPLPYMSDTVGDAGAAARGVGGGGLCSDRYTRYRPLMCVSVTQAAMPEQLRAVREVVVRRDPRGLFRNRWLSEVLDLP